MRLRWTRRALRRLDEIGSYIVAYRIRDDDIQVIAVLHAAQAWPTSF